MNHAEDMLESTMANRPVGVVEAEDDKEQDKYQKLLKAINDMKYSNAVDALSLSFSKVLNNIQTMVENLRMGESPDVRDVAKWHPLHRKVLTACESFCQHPASDKKQKETHGVWPCSFRVEVHGGRQNVQGE